MEGSTSTFVRHFFAAIVSLPAEVVNLDFSEFLALILQLAAFFHPAIFSVAIHGVICQNSNALKKIEIIGAESPKKKCPEGVSAKIGREQEGEGDFVHARAARQRNEAGRKVNHGGVNEESAIVAHWIARRLLEWEDFVDEIRNGK